MIGTALLLYSDQLKHGHAKPRAAWITDEGGEPGTWTVTYFGRFGLGDNRTGERQNIRVFDAKPPEQGRPFEYAVIQKCPCKQAKIVVPGEDGKRAKAPV